MPGPYPFKQIFAADPNNTENVAKGGEVLIFAPGDPSKTPLAITDLTGELSIPNPVKVNDDGFGPIFMHATLDQVAWDGGSFTGTYESYRGMKDDSEVSRRAAELAQAAAEEAAVASVAPAAEIVDAVLADPGSAASMTIAAATSEALTTAVAPLALKPNNGARAVGKNEIIHDVMDFGAIGDGVADDTPAIQAAIEAGEQSGLKVVVPRGTFKITTALRTLHGNLTLEIHSEAILERHQSFSDAMFVNGAKAQVGPGSSNISITGGVWDSRGLANGNGGSIIAIGKGNNIRVANATMKNIYLSHITEIAGCTNVVFDNIKFGGFSGTGTYQEAFQIERMTKTGFPYFNIGDDTPCRNVTISNCTQIEPDAGYRRWAVGVGGHANQDIPSASFVRVVDNDFGDCTFKVILSDFYTDSVFARNTGTAPTGIEINHNASGMSNISLMDNEIVATIAGLLLHNVTRATVRGGTYTGGYGIRLQGSQQIVLDATKAMGTNEAIIISNGAFASRIQSNIQILGTGFNGRGGVVIYDNATRVSVSDCYSINALDGQAVSIRGTATSVFVSGGHFRFALATYSIVAFSGNATGKAGVSGVAYPASQSTAIPPAGQSAQFTVGVNYPIL